MPKHRISFELARLAFADPRAIDRLDLDEDEDRPAGSLGRALRVSFAKFAKTFRIPAGTLRDWEQHRREPDQAAQAYLEVIARNPEAVIAALQASHRRGR